MKKLVMGMLAHVDAGKTTLSEAMLYEGGSIRTLGRVDKKDTLFDHFDLERQRGITIFSKQARVEYEGTEFTLLDTPGHVDFSTEMERTLQVIDYGILIISANDGIQAHTMTVWNLLAKYQIPVFLFVNKMDQMGADQNAILQLLQKKLNANIVDFSNEKEDSFYESIALSKEEVMNEYLETGKITDKVITDLVAKRTIFPCFFGSALKMNGVKAFLQGLNTYTRQKTYTDLFQARVFKITRDLGGNRLTHLKITGGCLKVKDVLSYLVRTEEGIERIDEKVNQIRLYLGEKFQSLKQAEAGMICTVAGLTKTYAGQGLGEGLETVQPMIEPVLTYQVMIEDGTDPMVLLPKLRELEEEDPSLHIKWDEWKKEIAIQVMGEVQLEILEKIIDERFHVTVSFGNGNILYKETICNTVEGVGHFEPLKHYAEVHLLLKPGEKGSGMHFRSECSEDMLSKNWQRLILTHLKEKQHRGVLTGAPITDMEIILVAGRAHKKHTEGGDFRQATYRAVRQGLMEAKSVLLEPYYKFCMELPTDCVGHAMMDIEKMKGVCEITESDGEYSVLNGTAPVSEMAGYLKELRAYTKGRGKLTYEVKGYQICHNQDEIIESSGYDPEKDEYQPSGSVFCAHGAGYYVPWNEVKEHMHLLAYQGLNDKKDQMGEIQIQAKSKMQELDYALGTEEIDQILKQTYYANQKSEFIPHKGIRRRNVPKETTSERVTRVYRQEEKKVPYMLVDGYNVIFAWSELNELAKADINAARGRLVDILCDYQGICQKEMIVVFDAYRVKGHETEFLDYHNIHIVYTKEAETADAFIEKFTHEHQKKYDITVVTSDGLEQIIITGAGCHLVSSRELEKEIAYAKEQMYQNYENSREKEKTYLLDGFSKEEIDTFTQKE